MLRHRALFWFAALIVLFSMYGWRAVAVGSGGSGSPVPALMPIVASNMSAPPWDGEYTVPGSIDPIYLPPAGICLMPWSGADGVLQANISHFSGSMTTQQTSDLERFFRDRCLIPFDPSNPPSPFTPAMFNTADLGSIQLPWRSFDHRVDPFAPLLDTPPGRRWRR